MPGDTQPARAKAASGLSWSDAQFRDLCIAPRFGSSVNFWVVYKEEYGWFAIEMQFVFVSTVLWDGGV